MNLQCIICMELYTSEDEIVITPCGHLFHKLCLTNWFQHQLNCAQCRTNCSTSNLQRVYLNSASDSEVHLVRHCNVETISTVLKETETNLKTVQDDLHTSNSTIIELKTIIASLQDLKVKNLAETQHLEQQLELTIVKYEQCDEDLKTAKEEIAAFKNELEAIPTSSNIATTSKTCESIASLEKELVLVKLQKQIVDDELKKAKEEISQMKCVTQALALTNIARYDQNVRHNNNQRSNNHQDCRQRPNNENFGEKNESSSAFRGDSATENSLHNLSNQNKRNNQRNRNRLRPNNQQNSRQRSNNEKLGEKNESSSAFRGDSATENSLHNLSNHNKGDNQRNRNRSHYNLKTDNMKPQIRNVNNTKTTLDEPWY